MARKGQFRPGQQKPPGSGRKKGTPNKLNSDVKAMILSALQRIGEDDYLVAQAAENPAAFLGLVGKILPMQVSGVSGGAPIVVVTGVPHPDDAEV